MKKKKILTDIAVIIGIAAVSAFVLFSTFELDIGTKQLIYKRSKIKAFDNVVVRHDRVFYSDLLVIGLPGDTIVINQADVYRNNKLINNFFIRQYLIDLSSDFDLKKTPEAFPIEFEFFTYDQFLKLKQYVLINPVVLPQYFWQPDIYPYNKNLSWNKDFFGKIIVPHKGMTLKLNIFTFMIYQPLIQKYEKTNIYLKNNKFWIKDKQITFYKFKHNYYFVINRNLNANFDSRFWGPIPRKEIIGKNIWSYSKLYSTVEQNFEKIKAKLHIENPKS